MGLPFLVCYVLTYTSSGPFPQESKITFWFSHKGFNNLGNIAGVKQVDVWPSINGKANVYALFGAEGLNHLNYLQRLGL